ncbi:MAG TPA: M36 family metallopeptidase [candidate division Zixibacteria bacterium]|nr:M36 family metallopeptidase [candidate division Zixibacteria bacterium]
MKKVSALLTGALLLLMLFGVILGMAGKTSANSIGDEPINFYPDRVSFIEYGGYLSQPSSEDPARIVREFAVDSKSLLGLGDLDLSKSVLTDQYTSDANGVTHVYLQQQWQGILVNNAYLNANVTDDGRLLTLNSSFIGDLQDKVNDSEPRLSPVEAVESAAEYLGLTITDEFSVVEVVGGDDAQLVLSTGGISIEPIPARLMYDPVSMSEVRLAWDIVIYEISGEHWWSMRVDANNGQILSQLDYIAHDNWGEQSVVPDNDSLISEAKPAFEGESGSTESYRVYAYPVESPIHTAPAPPSDGRTLELNPYDVTSSPYGWHDTDGAPGAEFTTTQGNNVHGYTDTNADNIPDAGSSPDGGTGLVFDFAVDLTQPPANYRPAAVTNLFYWNNVNHDVYYGYGFDETGGNFQESNYGNGGAGSDYVNAEAQDGSGFNNANFGTPPDGSNPRMQMYIFTAPNPDVGSSFDNGVITHEYGHGISNRLTGGPSQASCLGNDEQMGEGWSDLSTLFLTALPGHTSTTARGVGTYVIGEPPNGPGIRNYPYTTDLGVNPQTYGDVPFTGIYPHPLGEIWADMYWEVYWNLIDKHGFNPNVYDAWNTGGNNLAVQLYIDGMKIQPCSPGFVDGRDGILAADVALTGGENQCEIWTGFAKRGLGFSADQGSSDSRTDGTEAFDMPPSCLTVDTIPSPTSNDICSSDSATYLLGVGVNFTAPITMSGSTDAPAGSVSFTPNPVAGTTPALVDMEVTTTGATPFGTYTVNFTADDGSVSANGSTILNVFDDVPASISLTSPADGAVDVGNPPSFEWSASAQALSYLLEVDDDPGFGSIDYSAEVEGTSHDMPFNQPLAYGTIYYWRLTANNVCGDTASSVWEFTTEYEPGACGPSAITEVAYETDLESGVTGWTHSGTNDTWMLTDARTTSGVNAWYAEDLSSLSNQRLVSPLISLPPVNQSPITLQFQNYQAFEEPNGDGRCWDAGILEISSDSGSSWAKVPNSAMLTDPYDNIIWNDQPGNNPITSDYGATEAWCGQQQPFLNNVVLLDAYAGQQVQFRWRMGTDSAAGAEGWYLDDVKVQSCSQPQSKVFLPYVEEGGTTPPIQEPRSTAPFLGLIILPALIGILPIWNKRRQ